jgi:signal transduction histidine kinase
MNILEFLQAQSRRSIVIISVALVLLIGLADYLTGAEISFSIFYLIPIVLVGWFVSLRAGILFSVAGAVILLLADLFAGRVYSSSAIPFWNCGVRFGFFIIVNFMLSALRAAQHRQEELAHFIVHDLRSPLANVLPGLSARSHGRSGQHRSVQDSSQYGHRFL